MSTQYLFGDGHPCRDAVAALFLSVLFVFLFCGSLSAQTNNDHLLFSIGAVYERGLDATLAYEHSGRYHHAWEYFAGYHIKYEDDPVAGYMTQKSFWHSYNSWHVGLFYKPCVSRGRNHHGNLRIGASGGSDLTDFVGGIHVGYEHTFALKGGWELFFQVKEDAVLPKSSDVYRTGVMFGFKVPL